MSATVIPHFLPSRIFSTIHKGVFFQNMLKYEATPFQKEAIWQITYTRLNIMEKKFI